MRAASLCALVAALDFGSASTPLVQSTLQESGSTRQARVAVLNAHCEGNLGDEYETRPYLELLSAEGVTVDVYSSAWMVPESQMAPHAVRMLQHANAFYSSDEWIDESGADDAPLPGGEYDLLIYAPGPKLDRPVLLRMLGVAKGTGARLAIVGVTMAKSDWNLLRSDAALSLVDLVVVREADSFETGANVMGEPLPPLDAVSLAKSSGPTTTVPQFTRGKMRVILSGDSSFNYTPDMALLDFWSRFYRRQLPLTTGDGMPWYMLLCRNENHVGNNTLTNMTHVVVDVYDGDAGESTRQLAMPKERVVLATDSAVAAEQDLTRQQELHEQLGIGPEPLLLQNVEQMLALFGSSPQLQVVSDRYHPAMAAHRMGAPVHVIVQSEAMGDDSVHAGDPSTPALRHVHCMSICTCVYVHVRVHVLLTPSQRA